MTHARKATQVLESPERGLDCKSTLKYLVYAQNVAIGKYKIPLEPLLDYNKVLKVGAKGVGFICVNGEAPRRPT
jgi:hypothetical protein